MSRHTFQENDYRMRQMRRIKIRRMILAILLLALVLMIGIPWLQIQSYKNAEEKYQETIHRLESELEAMKTTEEISQEVVMSLISVEIKEIGELATVEYLYTNANKYSDPKQVLGVEFPFTTKSFVAKWDGIIKAGVDVAQITIKSNPIKNEIIICLPEAEILSHEIDADSFETLDEKAGLFNPIHIEDVRTFDASSKAAMEERAIKNGLLEKALENAKKILSGLIASNPQIPQNYTITFETITP